MVSNLAKMWYEKAEVWSPPSFPSKLLMLVCLRRRRIAPKIIDKIESGRNDIEKEGEEEEIELELLLITDAADLDVAQDL